LYCFRISLLDNLSNTEIKNKELLLDVIPSSKKLPKELNIKDQYNKFQQRLT